MSSIQPGSPQPLGATLSQHTANFAIFSAHATGVELVLYDATGAVEAGRHRLPGRTGDVWHGALPADQVRPGTPYAYHVDGPHDPAEGHRFDARLALIDPYARCLSSAAPLRSRVIDDRFDWQGDRPPATSWRDSVIYELHVKGHTQLHPGVPPELRGTYRGLAAPAVVAHLKTIGVTAVELLPCQSFMSEPFLTERGLTNYWGYNSVAWFAPANEYAVDDAVVEFKAMVRALHAAGLEVILDVVFNHTAEGGEAGPVLNLKGIDNAVYYRLLRDKRHYENSTGCGNTVNCEHPQVRSLVIDCLVYWVVNMHVDGFRFDLAPVLGREANGFNDRAAFFDAVRARPELANVKLIAEPWDIGWGGYQLGRFPTGWSEWNDRYRDTVRSFWRRDPCKTGELAERLAGSADIFRHRGRKPTASVNLVTAHDGFTLRDLVSYDQRHNEANLEHNADGSSNNLSWNCGVEGPSQDPSITALRGRQMRNLLATLFFSQGVPMLQAGDEFARTQQGNNNAYCQDNEVSWIDWNLCELNQDLVRFVALIARVRRENAEFRRGTFFKGAASPTGGKDVSWRHARGDEMMHEDWHDAAVKTVGVLYGCRNHSAGRFLLLINADGAAQEFVVPPPPPGSPWVRVFDTARGADEPAAVEPGKPYPLAASCVALLEC